MYVAPFPGPGGEHQVSSGGGTLPRWRRDGKELYYVTAHGEAMAAEVSVRSGTLETGNAHRLFEGLARSNIVGGLTTTAENYDVSADGQRFLVIEGGAATSSPLTLLQNWPATLRK